jgi:transcriptional antiterminator NusG
MTSETASEAAASASTKRWYVVHAYSGMEKSVARALQERINRAGLQAQFGRIMVPTEEVVEMKGGQKSISERRFFPGYVLVEMELTDETWHLVRSTPKVTGFVGSGNKPVSLPADQVDEIMRNMEAGAEKPKPKSVFQRGDKVRVIDGPFVNFQGVVEDMNPERGRMKVVVPVFGRPTSVELEYYQVERL